MANVYRPQSEAGGLIAAGATISLLWATLAYLTSLLRQPSRDFNSTRPPDLAKLSAPTSHVLHGVARAILDTEDAKTDLRTLRPGESMDSG